MSPSSAVVGDALAGLHRLGLASRDGERWQVHPLAVDATAWLGPPPVAPAPVAAAAARELAGLVSGADTHRYETVLLVRHARAVAG